MAWIGYAKAKMVKQNKLGDGEEERIDDSATDFELVGALLDPWVPRALGARSDSLTILWQEFLGVVLQLMT